MEVTFIEDIRDMKIPLNDIDSFKSLYPFFKNSGVVYIGENCTAEEYRKWNDALWVDDDTEPYIQLFDDLFLSVIHVYCPKNFEEEFWKSVRPVKMYESWLSSNF